MVEATNRHSSPDGEERHEQMQTPRDAASVSSAVKLPGETNARRIDDVVYQLMTVGAILLVLGSLWVF